MRDNPNILLVVGSYPPQKCGIGDYTKMLNDNLRVHKIETQVITNLNWSIFNLFSIIKEIKSYRGYKIHIQYPAIGYGYSLIPQLLSLYFKTFVTIHEVSQAFWLRKLSLLPFSFRSQLIFTTDFEANYFKKLFPWIRNTQISILPIGSNIEIAKSNEINNRSLNNVVYFGLIMPNKGIEDLLDLARIINAEDLDFKILIIGQVIDKYRPYFDQLQEQAKGLPVVFELNRSSQEVSSLLSKNLYAYLPFPDGISERRGSFLAAIANGMIVFTKKGKHTTSDLSNVVDFVDTPSDVMMMIREKEKSNFCTYDILKNEKYFSKFKWDNVILKQIEIYNS